MASTLEKQCAKFAQEFCDRGIEILKSIPIFWTEIVPSFINRRHDSLKYFDCEALHDEVERKKVCGLLECVSVTNVNEMGTYLAAYIIPKRQVIHKGLTYVESQLFIPDSDFESDKFKRAFNVDSNEVLNLQYKIRTLLDEYKKKVVDPMVRQYLDLVYSRAQKHNKTSVPFDDLVGYGSEGLVKAVTKFDFDRGIKFTTFAVQWIDEAILAGISKEVYYIHVGAHIKDDITRQYKHNDAIDNELQAVYDTAVRIRRFSELVTEDLTIGDKVANQVSMLEDIHSIESLEAWKHIQTLIRKRLTDTEYKLLCMRYGLFGYEEHTLRQLSKIFNISDEWVRQKVMKILKKLTQDTMLCQVLEDVRTGVNGSVSYSEVAYC